MKYQWEYIVFGSKEPTVKDIEAKIKESESESEEYESDHDCVDSLVEQIVEENYCDWELEEDENIYISIYPKGKPEEQELFDVHLSLVIQAIAYHEWSGLD